MFVQLRDYPDYVVTPNGDVISLVFRNGTTKSKPQWKSLKGFVCKRGYRYVDLSVNGMILRASVHRLVASAYLGLSDLDVNHVNGNKLDNRPENLEYCTKLENMQHASRTGLLKPKTKLSPNTVASIRQRLAEGASQSSLAKQFNTSQSNVSLIAQGKTWAHINRP